MENKYLKYCPVCGYPTQPNDIFTVFAGTCTCCAFEFGIDEPNYGDNPFVKYRLEWINDGLKFMTPSENPKWNLDEALANLKNLKKLNISDYVLHSKIDNSDWTWVVDEDLIRKRWIDFHG